jgi:signal transduction histidine kinase
LDSSVDEGLLSKEAATTAFRILQEALTNVARHAHAGSVEVVMSSAGGRLVMMVSDDGRGINEEQQQNTRSLGLMGMQERALALGGTLPLEGEPDKGTQLTLTLPLHENVENAVPALKEIDE